MYNDFLERIIAGALLLSLILPFFVTQLLAAGSGEKPGRKHINQYWWFILLINLGLNSVVMYAVYARFAGPQKPLEQLATVLGMKCAYRDFWPVAKTSLTGMVFAFAAGFGIKLLLHPLTWGRISAASMGRLIGVVVLWLPVFMLGSSMSLQDAHHLHITEICRKTTALVDASGKDEAHAPIHHDEKSYITLVNNGILTCRAEQLFFSDDADQPRKYEVTELVIPPKEEYTVVSVYQHMIDYQDTEETRVLLSDQQGKLLDFVMVPVLADEETYVQDQEDGSWRIRGGIPRESSDEIAVPVFSHQGGFYDQPFDLTISAESGKRIYYTLDGSIPDTESILYDKPVHVENRSGEPNRYRSIPNVVTDYLDKQGQMVQEPVDKAVVVRAVAADDQGRMSGIVTQTYFVQLGKYRDVAVVSIVADPDDFFGDDGIYVTGADYDAWYAANAEWISENPKRKHDWIWEDEPEPNFMKRGDAWERAGNVELLKGGQELINQPAGFAISGSSTRDTFFKRLNVYARKIYSGSSQFEFPFMDPIR